MDERDSLRAAAAAQLRGMRRERVAQILVFVAATALMASGLALVALSDWPLAGAALYLAGPWVWLLRGRSRGFFVGSGRRASNRSRGRD